MKVLEYRYYGDEEGELVAAALRYGTVRYKKDRQNLAHICIGGVLMSRDVKTAVQGCKDLRRVILPEGVESI